MSNKSVRFIILGGFLLAIFGCGYLEHTTHIKNRVCNSVDKICLGRDHVKTKNMPILEVARCVTQFEDQLRRDGTISAKTPDVWTDSNLMHSIQEFDQEMEKSLDQFSETIQAFISESDREGLLSELEAAFQAEGATFSAIAENGSSTRLPPATDLSSLGNLNINAAEKIFSALSAIPELAKPKGEFRLEPTERERQHATYINVNQSLRRGKMGGDNTRRAGYGLYLFRIPVSVIPGEETHQGYSAVANFRARMQLTPADVKYTLPRMAIAELVDVLAPKVRAQWETKLTKSTEDRKQIGANKRATVIDQQKEFYSSGGIQEAVDNQFPGIIQNDDLLLPPLTQENAFDSIQSPTIGVADVTFIAPRVDVVAASPINDASSSASAIKDANAKFTLTDILQVRDFCKNVIGIGSQPELHELRTSMFNAFVQISIHLQQLNAFDVSIISESGQRVNAIQAAAKRLEIGKYTSDIGDQWKAELNAIANHHSPDYLHMSWFVARHCGLTDLNIKRLIYSLHLKKEFTADFVAKAQTVNFFSNYQLEAAAEVWQALVEAEFPLQVFTLEPIVEEQNLLDSQSRLRQMQMALAYSVAYGAWNVAQRVNLAKELARDSAAIGVNRTNVGFVHGMDTFGWYFYPRVQSPDRINKGIIGNVLLPQTRKEDAKTYKLEPGIRECEVLIAMPSFVTQLAFDVTTNWERLSKPGKAKRSYEELILEGCKLQELRQCLCSQNCIAECRPGDVARLNSRIEQLEDMLAMQTHVVDVPYDYDHPAGELFDEGERSLRPEIYGYHGLSALSPKEDKELTVEFFVTGKNFHPTLTHVIVEGNESHSVGSDPSTVEILSRQLIRVQTKLRPETFAASQFEVRVGTPSGMSGPIFISKAAEKKASDATPKAPSAFDWKDVPKFDYYAFYNPLTREELPKLKSVDYKPSYLVNANASNPITDLQLLESHNNRSPIQVKFVYEVTYEDKSTKSYKAIPRPLSVIDFTNVGMTHLQLTTWLYDDLRYLIKLPETQSGTIKVTSYLMIDDWPLEQLDKTMEIKLIPCTTCNEGSTNK